MQYHPPPSLCLSSLIHSYNDFRLVLEYKRFRTANRARRKRIGHSEIGGGGGRGNGVVEVVTENGAMLRDGMKTVASKESEKLAEEAILR